MIMQALKTLGCLLPLLGAAAMAGEIGYLDTDKAAQNYHFSISRNAALNQKTAKITEEVKRRSQELQALKAQILARQAESATQPEKPPQDKLITPLAELQLQALKLEAELKDFCTRQEALIRKETGELQAELVKDLETQLAAFAKEKKLEAVVNVSDRDFPYYDKRKDITDAFLAKINVGHEDYINKMKARRDEEKLKAAAAKGEDISRNRSSPAKADAQN